MATDAFRDGAAGRRRAHGAGPAAAGGRVAGGRGHGGGAAGPGAGALDAAGRGAAALVGRRIGRSSRRTASPPTARCSTRPARATWPSCSPCWRGYGLTPADLPRACDYGCGVGRMTRPMAGVPAVTGCDVSPPHLTLARQASGAAVGFALVSVPEFGMAAPFDLWFSTLTLQHNPPPVIALILRRHVRAAGAGRRRGVPAADRAGRLRVRPGGLPRARTRRRCWRSTCCRSRRCSPWRRRPAACRWRCGRMALIWPPTACISNRFVFPRVAALR